MAAHHHGHDHDHGHDHEAHEGHGHDHGGHHHVPTEFGNAFAIGVALNIGFVLVEGGAGWYAGSIALIADAGHNLSDVLGLLMAWTAHTLAKRPPSARYTYGLRGSSILAALFNAIFLMIACGAIITGAVERLLEPVPVQGGLVMAVAAVGIAINLGTALMFMRGGKDDINIRGAFLHMAADAAVSAGVVVAGLIVLETGLTWIDPLISIVIVFVIVAGTWGLFRDSLSMSLQGVPGGIDVSQVTGRLATLPGVAAVHHVHIWPTSTTETALTAHLLMPAHDGDDAFLTMATAMIRKDFGIAHATFQIERGICADEGGCDPTKPLERGQPAVHHHS